MKKVKCSECAWYNPQNLDPEQGECRRIAPDNGWDKVYPNDWCGEFELDEEASHERRNP